MNKLPSGFGVDSVYLFGGPGSLNFSDRGFFASEQNYYRINVITSYDLRQHFFENFNGVFKRVLQKEANSIFRMDQPLRSFHSYLYKDHLSKECPAFSETDLDLMQHSLEYALRDMPKGFVNFLFINLPFEEMHDCLSLEQLDGKIENLLTAHVQLNEMIESDLGYQFTRH